MVMYSADEILGDDEFGYVPDESRYEDTKKYPYGRCQECGEKLADPRDELCEECAECL